jgi:ABC-type dipeptide/oligopeptide/nickel transport system permease subunit
MMQWRRVFAHRSASVGLVLVALALLTALLAPLVAPHDPVAQNRSASGKPPGFIVATHASPENRSGSSILGDARVATTFHLGTDINGRDILSRVIFGARISLLVGVVATLLNLLLGMLVGTLSGYYGGWVDLLLMRITDIFFAFPSILLAIIILATLNQPAVREAMSGITGRFDPGIWGLFIALGLTGWTGVARIIRGQVLALKEREFIEAARAIGASNARIMLMHLVPNCIAPVIVVGTLQVAYNILSEAGLSFLGLGIQPPQASWGGMLAEARPFLSSMPWWGVFPGIALALTVLGFNLFGDGLRDLLDPRLRSRLG